MRQRTPAIIPLLSFGLLGIIVIFNRFLLRLASYLPGSREAGATALWHLWWPTFGWNTSDALSFGLPMSAWSGGPYISNHLAEMPIVQSLIFAPLNLVTGNPVLAFNLTLIVLVALAYAAVMLWLRECGVDAVAAALGGLAMVTSGWAIGLLSAADVVLFGFWPLPLALLLWKRWLRDRKTGQLIALVIVLYGSVLSGVQYLAWITNLWLPYALWTGWQTARDLSEADRRQWLRPLATAGLALLVLILVYPAQGMVRTLIGNQAPYGPAAPLIATQSVFVSLVFNCFAILTILGILMLATDAWQGVQFWLILGGGNLLFALGLFPSLNVMVYGTLWLPFQAMYHPSMFYGPALLCMITAASEVYPSARARFAQMPSLLLLAGVLLLIGVGAFIRVREAVNTPIADYPVLETFRDDPEDYFVLHLPFGVYSTLTNQSLGSDPDLMIYSLWHQKRAVSGINSAYDGRHIVALESAAFLTNPNHPDAVENLRAAVTTWRIGYVVIHHDRLADGGDAIRALIEKSGELCPGVGYAELTIYRANWHPEGCDEQG